MKLRYFYKINHLKQPIPGSNIKRKSKPGNQWLEIKNICCNTQTISCSCDFRFFVQLDAKNNPVSGTLIKRDSYPKMEDNIKYQEIDWKSVCCDNISFEFENMVFSGTGSLIIKVNNNIVVQTNGILGGTKTGNFRPFGTGDLIEIIINNNTINTPDNNLTIIGGHTTVQSNSNSILSYSFIWNGKSTQIFVSIGSAD